MSEQTQTTVDANETNSVPPTAEVKVAETTPKVEVKDGKIFVDGVRVYHRDETNKIAATAKQDAVKSILGELEVDNLDQIKQVVKSLRTASTEGNNTLDIDQLRDTVKRKEQTVEELQKTVQSLKQEMVLKDHMTQLYGAMPTAWSKDQRDAVVDLMKARNMIQVDGEQFVIRNGESYLTEDGEKPDYKGAVDLVGKTLGFPMAKVGVDVPNVDKAPRESTIKTLDENLLKTDAKYRSAYTQIRTYSPNLPRTSITDNMIRSKMAEMEKNFNPGLTLQGNNLLAKQQTVKTKRK